MCGLVGAFAFGAANREELEAPMRGLMARIARRGPDDEGLFVDHRCALGFRRLAILDLGPAGHQPMSTPDGRYTLVFNGEIYNFREIAATLADHGVRPRSTGDAEVLLLALKTWGVAALQRLEGMFALAFYDSLEQTILLARDHAGIKPLYYGTSSRGLVFGSQYDQIIAHPWHRGGAPDLEMLGLYLRLGFVAAPYGLHRSTGQLEAGQWMKFDATGQVERGMFFDLLQWSAPVYKGADAREALAGALSRSVRRHLESDVPVGVFLSGGIDSPLVAAEAVRQHGGVLQAFTIGVDDPSSDESLDAKRYADEIGLEQHVERITSLDALAMVDDVVRASTEPTADYSMFPTLMVSRLARRHVKVVLSGDGGDELFFGYPSRFISAIGQARYFGWPRVARYAAIAARRFGRGAATRDVVQHDSIGELYRRKHTLLAEPDLAAIFPTLPPMPAGFHDFDFTRTDADDVAQWVRWNEFRVHLARVLAKVDRASMFHSLEVRVPLLDKEVIEVAWKTDWRSSLDLEARQGKQPLRDLLARRVRHSTRTKKGFTVPMGAWLAGPLRPLVRDALLTRREILGLPIRAGALETLVERAAHDASKAWGVWLLLSLSLWERTYG